MLSAADFVKGILLLFPGICAAAVSFLSFPRALGKYARGVLKLILPKDSLTVWVSESETVDKVVSFP